MLCDLMVQHGLIALNTRFKKLEKKLWTFMYPDGEKGQLDYIVHRIIRQSLFKTTRPTHIQKIAG